MITARGRIAGSLLWAAGLAGACGSAAAWEFTPQITIAETYTSNATLAPDGLEEDEFVTQLIPAFALIHASERLNVDVGYRMQNLFYIRESDRNQTYHQAHVDTSLAVFRNRFFLEAGGDLTQTLIDPEQAFSRGNIASISNRTNATTYDVGPRWIQDIGRIAVMDVAYKYGEVFYDDDTLQDLTRQFTQFSLANPFRNTGPTWRLAYEYQRLEFDLAPEAEFASASLELGFAFSEALRIFGRGGLESDYREHRTEADLDSEFWDVGVSGMIGTSDSYEVRAGERLFGSTLQVRWDHEVGAAVFGLAYTEAETTSSGFRFGQRLRVDQTEFDFDDIDRPGEANIFVRERLEGRFAYDFTRSQLSLRVYSEERKDQETATGEQLGDDESIGAHGTWRWQVGARTSAGVRLGWIRREFRQTDRVDENRQAGIDVQRELGRRSSAQLEILRRERESDAAAANEFTENLVTISLTMIF